MMEVDNVYAKSFKEVSEILKLTDESIVKKIPKTFMEFIEKNKSQSYSVTIPENIELEKIELLDETENILALIYRDYIEEDDKWKNKEKNKNDIILNKDIFRKNKQKEIEKCDLPVIIKKKGILEIIGDYLKNIFNKNRR